MVNGFRLLLCLLSVLSAIPGFAQGKGQSIQNLQDTILPISDTLQFDQGSIFLHTLRARLQDSLTPLSIESSSDKAWITNPESYPDGSLVIWSYRRFSLPFDTIYALLDSGRLRNLRPIGFWEEESLSATAISLNALQRDLGTVEYNGVFGRGLRFGNSQNLVLDSRLDLQLNGDLGEGLKVAAVVSDQNIPIQPEGNTVQLREFDRIFVTVSKEAHSLTAGDYTLRSNDGHFLRFDKNLQGLLYSYGAETAGPFAARASLAATRGIYRRIQIPVEDGNQGPYRLSGERGEPFVIVLAGTERIWLDGRLLERGLDRDYIIDYNRGEVTFMPRLLINRFQRVIAEYEYTDQEYLRSLLTAESRYRSKKVEFRIQGLQQQDGLRRSGSALSDEAEAVLRSSPGSNTGVLVPSALPLEADAANPIQYFLQADTSDCGLDSIWVFASEPQAGQAFSVVFTEVGEGLGDYIEAPNLAANGLAFRAVPRDRDCRPRGRYAPVRVVQTPRALRLLSLGADWRPDSSSLIRSEWAINDQDLNRFAPGSQQAMAGFVSAEKLWRVKKWSVQTSAYAEGRAASFEGIAPWRNQEFRRLWNLGQLGLSPTAQQNADWLAGAKLGLQRGALTGSYSLDSYQQEQTFSGFRQNWLAGYRKGPWWLEHSGDWMRAERDDLPTARRALQFTSRYQQGRRLHEFKVSELLSRNYDLVLDRPGTTDRNLYEWLARSSLAGSDTTWSGSLVYSGRRDELLASGTMEAASGNNHQIDLLVNSPAIKRQGLEISASYRHNDDVVLDSFAQAPIRNYYLGRLLHRLSTAQSWLRTQSSVELGSGQERRVSIQFVKVQAGLGQFIWKDYNGDGVEQLDEFEQAVFADSASYLRTVLLTDDFVATNTLALSQGLFLEPSRLKGGSNAWWGRFSMNNSVNLRRRALQSAGYTALFQVNLPTLDTAVVGDDLGWRTALYFNRAREAFRVELDHRQQAIRSITVQGLEFNRSSVQGLRLQQPLGKAWRLGILSERELRRSGNEGLAQRNFALRAWESGPELSFQPSPEIRLLVSGQYREARSIEGEESVFARNLNFEADIRVPEAKAAKGVASRLAGTTLRARVSRVSQRYNGQVNAPIGFALLEGLQPGESWVWSLSSDQQLGRSLQLTLRYDGRQLGGGRVVHTGQAQLQAVF